MKQITITLILLVVLASAQAQMTSQQTAPAGIPKLSINALGGYVFNDNVTTDDYHGKVEGGFQWQVGLEFGLKKYYGLELYYVRQDANAEIHGPLQTKDIGMAINYVMLGGKRYAYLGSDHLMAYGGLSIGAAFGHNKDSDGDFSKFAWGIRAGLRAQGSSTSRVGFLFQAQLLSAVQAASGGFYFGTGGAGTGVSTYSTIYQFGLSAGLAIALK